LYAGRIDRAKGLFEIVEALSQLVHSGFDVIFDIVGAPANNDSILVEIEKLACSLNIEDRVLYHGYKSAGSELLSYYRQADLFITASRANEGFPRTIWEAMASGLPVVATRVGSIPAFIDGAALLVPPKQAQALSEAIKDLLTNPHLRQELIASGLKLAQANTLEKRSHELVFQMKKWLISSNREMAL
jgi:glycosyltransferase involved in cell wall biosynthesis